MAGVEMGVARVAVEKEVVLVAGEKGVGDGGGDGDEDGGMVREGEEVRGRGRWG